VRIVLNAVAATASIVAGVIFLRFRRETTDRLFGGFAFAFWMFALNYLLLALVDTADETRVYLYLPRLAGFLTILVSIVDRNRR
jgi:hypothetical protein